MHVDEGVAAVAHQVMAVDIEHEVGGNVGHAVGDDKRIFDIFCNFDIRIAVFDGADELFRRVDDIFIGADKFDGVVVLAAGDARLFIIARIGKRRRKKRRDEQR